MTNFSFADVEPAREIDAEEFGRGVAEAVKSYVDRAVNARCAALETKLALLEQRSLSYQGVWRDGKTYGAGNFVTHSGALWHSNIFCNKQRPGDGDAAWTLAVKSGERGRDAKGAA
jgi:hypothetical protein